MVGLGVWTTCKALRCLTGRWTRRRRCRSHAATGAGHRQTVRADCQFPFQGLVAKKNERHPPILIAASFQALNRAIAGREDTRLCDCTVVILFAGFYVEANLNYIIQCLGKTREMRAFLGGRHPGLGDKLAWDHNEYVARNRAPRKADFKKGRIFRKTRARFPGFAKLYRFRNDLSHGIVNPSAESIVEARRLRELAKQMVRGLYRIANHHGHNIQEPIDYYKAIGLKPPAAPPNTYQPSARQVGRYQPSARQVGRSSSSGRRSKKVRDRKK